MRVGRASRVPRRSTDKAFWATKNTVDAALAQFILHKQTLPIGDGKRPFTLEEKAYWRKTRPRKLPKGC